MATSTPHPAPLARQALRRQNSREEPSALTRTLGSVRGAAGNGGPYRDPACQEVWKLPGKRCASPALSTTAASATIGQPIQDTATLSGGESPTGTISWNVYSGNDHECSQPLNPSPLTIAVGG